MNQTQKQVPLGHNMAMWKYSKSCAPAIIIDCFYIVLFSTLKQTHCTRMWFYMSEQLFIACFLISTEVVYLQRWHGWCHMKLLPSQRILCTPCNHAPCHFMQSHIRMVYACLAVTNHLHFWQNDRGLLHATVVTQGWNRCRNKSQHRKLTLEKKTSASAEIRTRNLSITSPTL